MYIVTGLAEVLLDNFPFKQAHRDSFRHLLPKATDSKIDELCKTDAHEIWDTVLDLMGDVMGHDVSISDRTYYARALYGMQVISHAQPQHCHPQYLKLLKDLSQEQPVYVVTSLPTHSAQTLLEKLQINHLFEGVYGTSMIETPENADVMHTFAKEVGEDGILIDNNKHRLEAVQHLEINSIAATWFAPASCTHVDHSVNTITELRKILNAYDR